MALWANVDTSGPAYDRHRPRISVLCRERPTLVVLLSAGAAVIAVRHVLRRRLLRVWRLLRRLGPAAGDPEATLRRLCGGERAVVERLILLEMQRDPQLSRADAARVAATRLRRDR